MNVQLLIDSIVQQTTVLIAQLSTAAGIRAPLANIADQVFVELSRELNEQGVSRRVAAGMFGLTIRSYQKKLRRLEESHTRTGKTLWESILAYLREREHVRREEILRAFALDPERAVGAVLKDLVTSGLVSQIGRGPTSVYHVTNEQGLKALREGREHEHAVAQIWLAVHDNPGLSKAELLERYPELSEQLPRSLERLILEGKLRVGRTATERQSPREMYYATELMIPVGTELGWEVAVFDHFRSVVNAISAKARAGVHASRAQDVTGGMTLSFELWEGHPHRERVYQLLQRVRTVANELWQEVEQYNAEQRQKDVEVQRLYFYAGQYVEESTAAEAEHRDSD